MPIGRLDYQKALKAMNGNAQAVHQYAQENNVQLYNMPKGGMRQTGFTLQQQPSLEDNLITGGKNVLGGLSNLLPTIGNIFGSGIGGNLGMTGGAAAGAALPGAGETGVPEVAGGVAGEVAGSAAGGSVGEAGGELLNQFIRQHLLGLDKPNAVQNKKALAESAEEGGLYGLLPMGNGSKGILGFLKRAVVGGGINGAAQVVQNANEGKPLNDKVGWQSFLGGLFNGVIGGAFDKNYDTVQLSQKGEPQDFFQAAKTNPKEFMSNLLEHTSQVRTAINSLKKASLDQANQIEDNLQNLLQGKTAFAHKIVQDLDSIANENNYNFVSKSKDKMVHGTIEKVKQFITDAAEKATGAIENPTGDKFMKWEEESPTIKGEESVNPQFKRMGGVKPGEKGPPGYLKETGGKPNNPYTIKGKGFSAKPSGDESLGMDSGGTFKNMTPAQQQEYLKKNGPMFQSQTAVPHVQTIDQLKENHKLDLATINEAKRLLSSHYNESPVFKQMYHYLQSFIEQGSGNPDAVKAVNDMARAQHITTQTLNKHLDSITEKSVNDAVKQLLETGDTSALGKIQESLKLIGMNGGFMFGKLIGHPYIMGSLGHKIGGAVGEKGSQGIENILSILNHQSVQQLMQQGTLRGARQFGNISGGQQ